MNLKRYTVMWLLIIVTGVVISVCGSVEAKITAYFRYDADMSTDICADSQFYLHSQPSIEPGSQIISADGGRPNAGGALVIVPTIGSVYQTDSAGGIGQILNSDEGTVEMWIAPNWNGVNQGGAGVGGSGATQALFNVGGGSFTSSVGLHFGIFNNNYPDDGGQLFIFWIDSDLAYRDLNGSSWQPTGGDIYGTTADWVAGQWHHVAFCWNEITLSMFLDGGLVDETTRPSAAHAFSNDVWIGAASGSPVAKTWDGKIDDLLIWDEVRYAGIYSPPNSLPNEPQTNQDVWDWGFGIGSDFDKNSLVNFLDFAILAGDEPNLPQLAFFVNDWLRTNDPCDLAAEKPWRTNYCPTDPCEVLENPSFEDSSDSAAAFWAFQNLSGQYSLSMVGNAHTGDKCLAITGIVAGTARSYGHNVYFVEGASYRLSGWVKSEGAGISGHIQIPNAGVIFYFTETPQWTYMEKYFVAPHTDMDPIYLFSYGLGTVFFDDISVEMTRMPTVVNKQTIPTNTEPLTEIIIPDNPTVADQYAAIEIQRVLKEMTGVELDIIPQPYSVFETGGIYVNCAPDMNDYIADLASIGDEGIVLDINDNIVCLGNTKRGVYYATGELLYQLGCRWYTPWDGGECIPSESTVTLPYQKIVHDPSFEMRGNKTGWSYHYPPAMAVDTYYGGFIDWAGHNKMNALKGHYVTDFGYSSFRGQSTQDWGGHTIHTIVNPGIYFDDHPEYFPEVNYPEGTLERQHTTPWCGRPTNVCVSNTDVIQICADFVIDYFDTHPYATRVHIGQMDVGAHCECGPCKALDPPGSVDWDEKANGAILVVTDRWVWFINQIADIVKLAHPTKYVATYAYAETLTRPINPANNPGDNTMMELTWSFLNLQDLTAWQAARCYKHDMSDPACPNNVEGMAVLNEWVALAPISIYSYYLYYNNPGTAGSYFHHDASFYRAIHDAGVRHINDEVGTDMLSAPLLLNLRARLLWDINTDVDEYIDEFCDIVYGPGSIFIKQYFAALEETVTQSVKTHVHFNDFDLFSPAILAELNDYLDSAELIISRTGKHELLPRIARLRLALIYTEIKTLTNPAAIDTLQADAYDLVQLYNIPVKASVWSVIAP